MMNSWRNKPWDGIISDLGDTELGRAFRKRPEMLPAILGILTAPFMALYLGAPFTSDRLILWFMWMYLNFSQNIHTIFDSRTVTMQVRVSKNGGMDLTGQADTLRLCISVFVRKGFAGALLLIPYFLVSAIFWLMA